MSITGDNLYHVNPYGERINFSLAGQYGVFKNKIVTAGAMSFNQDEFCTEVFKIFAANRLVYLGLVVAEINKYKWQTLSKGLEMADSAREIRGVGLDAEKIDLAPFYLKGIKSEVTPEQIKAFIQKYSYFTNDRAIAEVHLNSPQDSQKGLDGDKHFIVTQLPNGKTHLSSLYTNAKQLDFINLIKDLEDICVGKVISITRQLALGQWANKQAKDLNHIVPWGVTGTGYRTLPNGVGKTSLPFGLEWVDQKEIWTGVGAFLKKYMRIRSLNETVAIKQVKIAKNYEIKLPKKVLPASTLGLDKHKTGIGTNESLRPLDTPKPRTSGLPTTKREFAAQMRYAPTPAEAAMRAIVRQLTPDCHFKEQITIAGYIADFYCAYKKVAIEVDGKSHDSIEAQKQDTQKEIAFYRHQIITLRVKNEDALNNPEAVKALISNGVKRWMSTPYRGNWELPPEAIYQLIKEFRDSLL